MSVKNNNGVYVMKIFFVRHGAAQSNVDRRYLGRGDEPLCREGREQARALFESGVPAAERVFVSPLLRCRQTAEILYPGAALETAPQFAELDFGSFEGKTHQELTGDPAYAAWLESGGTFSIPGGETLASFTERCREGFLWMLERAADAASLAAVVHSGTIMALLSGFAVPPRPFYGCYVKNCGCVLCCWDGVHLAIEGGDLE